MPQPSLRLARSTLRLLSKPSRPLRPAPSIPASRYLSSSRPHLDTPPSTYREPPPPISPPTDLNDLDILSNLPPPNSAVHACLPDGFILNGGARIDHAGLLLLAGEAFRWYPSGPPPSALAAMPPPVKDPVGRLALPAAAFALLAHAAPKPDLLLLGTGARVQMLDPATRASVAELGIRLEVLDTRNAAAQFAMLATERGGDMVAAMLIPLGWK